MLRRGVDAPINLSIRTDLFPEDKEGQEDTEVDGRNRLVIHLMKA